MSIRDEVNAAVRAELDRATEKNNNRIVMVSLVGNRGYGITGSEKADYEVCYTYTRGVEDYLSLGPLRMLPTQSVTLLSNGATLTITNMDIKALLDGFLIGDLNCLQLPFMPPMEEMLGYRDEWWVSECNHFRESAIEYAEQWFRPYVASDQYWNRLLSFSKGLPKEIPDETKALLAFDKQLLITVRYGMCSVYAKAHEKLTLNLAELQSTLPYNVAKAWELGNVGLFCDNPMVTEDRLALLNMVKTLVGARGVSKLIAPPTPRLGDPRQLSSFFRWVIGYRP